MFHLVRRLVLFCTSTLLTYIYFLFFFSSRRRHTRYWRDWSSDVCSSDLGHYAAKGADKHLTVTTHDMAWRFTFIRTQKLGCLNLLNAFKGGFVNYLYRIFLIYHDISLATIHKSVVSGIAKAHTIGSQKYFLLGRVALIIDRDRKSVV